MFWQQGRTHYLQLTNPKKTYLKTGKIFGFSQNLSFGVIVGMFVFWGRLANFRKKKKKLAMIFYKYLIILLYSCLHIGKKILGKNVTIFFLTCDH